MRSAFFSNLTVKSRIGFGFGLILLMMVALTIVSIAKVNFISDSLETIGDVNSVKQRYAINFRGSVHDRAISLRDVTLVSSEDELNEALSEISRLSADYEKSAVLLDKMFAERTDIGAEERQILASIKETETRTLPVIKKVAELRQSGNVGQATDLLLKDGRPAFIEWLARINQFIDLQEKMNQFESSNAREVASKFQTLMLIICAAALLIGTAVAVIVVKAIASELGGEPYEASAIARNIAAGNLAVPIQISARDRSSVLFAMC